MAPRTPARACVVPLIALCAAGLAESQSSGPFRWVASQPLFAPLDRGGDHYYSIKDPTVVSYGGRWHLFCTVRGQKRSHQIEYLSFTDWEHAGQARRQMLTLTSGYFCAPQVFYFRPHKKWYLIYQATDQSRKPVLQPAFSTTANIDDPSSWTPPALLFEKGPKIERWIDFWVIADADRAHLFFTSLDGKMWRAETTLSKFPAGWSEPKVVLEDDIFEASHTYRMKAENRYLTVVEAQAGGGGPRYYKAYEAKTLDGKWTPLAASASQPFASPVNVAFRGESWTDSFSHGELIREGYDETLTVDPKRLRFLFQGVRNADRQGRPYGEIPWRLGLIEPAR